MDRFVEPNRQFVKDSIQLLKRCTKPDRKELQKIAIATAIGFALTDNSETSRSAGLSMWSASKARISGPAHFLDQCIRTFPAGPHEWDLRLYLAAIHSQGKKWLGGGCLPVMPEEGLVFTTHRTRQ